jgi:hypothetical protein
MNDTQKKFIYFIYVSILFIPVLLAIFFLGGIDAVIGTRLYPKFHNFMKKISSRFWYD